MRNIYIFLLIFLQAFWLPQALADKEVVGWVEKARIYPGEIELKAKVDTGALTTSLNCDCSVQTDDNGEKRVRFTLVNYKGETLEVERKIVRMVKIKRHFGRSQERPVIKLGICLSGTYRDVEVNLVDRTGMNYQLLIGRTFLQDHFIVDPAASLTREPDCSNTAQAK